MISNVLSFWAWTGLVSLIFLSFQDILNKKWVDDRKNWFMIGTTFVLIPALGLNIWYALAGILVNALYLFLAYKFMKGIGEADHNAIFWILLGFYFSGAFNLLIFACVMVFCLFLHYLIYKKVMQEPDSPFFPTLTIIFAVTAFLTGVM